MRYIPYLLLFFAILVSCTQRGQEQARSSAERPNVLLIVVDTLTTKHLGAYNPSKNTSPHIDKLASESALFERAYSTAPWTKPAITSLFTSLYPSQHGVRGIHDTFDESLTSLPDILKTHAYYSKGLVSHTLITPKKGYGQGFDAYEVVPFTGNVHDAITSQTVSGMAIDWLKQRKQSDAPFFLYLHYFDAHFNYQHHKQYDRSSWYKGKLHPGIGFRELRKIMPTLTEEDYRYLRALYDEEIQYTDHYLGQVIATLEELGLRENTIIVLTADHGEAFGERGAVGHTETLHDELVHVPFLVSWPKKITPRRISETIGTVDFLPSILELLGIQTKEEKWQGVSFAKALLGRARMAVGRTYFSEVDFKSHNISAYFQGAFRDEWKYIHNKKTGVNELFNVQNDPDEKSNVLKSSPDAAKGLEQELERFRGEITAQGALQQRRGKEKPKQTKEEIEQLKSLGYL